MTLMCNGARVSLSIEAMDIGPGNALIMSRLRQHVVRKILTAIGVETVQNSVDVVVILIFISAQRSAILHCSLAVLDFRERLMAIHVVHEMVATPDPLVSTFYGQVAFTSS